MEPGTGMDVLERWVAAHHATVFRAAFMILRDRDAAEDTVQDTFLRAHRAAERLRPGAEVRPWLYRIAVNTALNRLRSLRRENAALARIGAGWATPDHAEEQATRSVVTRAVAGLPDRLRIPLVLRYYLDLSERDIARTLRIRPGTVKSRLHEARRELAGDEGLLAAAGRG